MIPQHAWVNKLFGYQFTVEFKPGKQNTVIDALSRRDEDGPVVFTLSLPKFDFFDQFCLEATTLPEVIANCAKIEREQLVLNGPSLMTWWYMTDACSCLSRPRCGHSC
jgi:hypothetical protein